MITVIKMIDFLDYLGFDLSFFANHFTLTMSRWKKGIGSSSKG